MIRNLRLHLSASIFLLTVAGCQEYQQQPLEPGAPPLLAAAGTGVPYRSISPAFSHTCAVTDDDVAYCWGLGTRGRLGTGNTLDQLRPAPVAGGLRFRQIETQYDVTCGLALDDRAYCWGQNDRGQLGDGTMMERLQPVAVAGNRRFRMVSTGATHTCAVNIYDRVFCWGANEHGQLGTGTTVPSLLPVRIRSGGRRFRQVSAGRYYTCAVTTEQQVVCWGSNKTAMLGDGSREDRYVPTPVYGSHWYVQVDAGSGHTCAIATDGRAYCWGLNTSGQLGIGDTVAVVRLRPREVAGGRHYASISAGGGRTCGVTLTAEAYCWGTTDVGGETLDLNTPTAVPGNMLWTGLSTGGAFHYCGVGTEAHVGYCWGYNGDGQLGDGTRDNRDLPGPVADPL